MKLLLIGPYPPPHGGISTHVLETKRKWREAGVPCQVLDPGNAGLRFAWRLLQCGFSGWSFHVHTNGHNPKSWLLAGLCGTVGKIPGDCVLTLHSGMLPAYLGHGQTQLEPLHRKRRVAARLTCSLFRRVICVNAAIRDALAQAGVPAEKLEVHPAFMQPSGRQVPLNPLLRAWMMRRSPVLSTALFFRPEYGFELLLESIAKLRRSYPAVGCVVMGSGEEQPKAERLLRDSGVGDNIFLAGDVSHDTCLAVMSRSDLFVRPTFEDGDSVSVREALALGVPVVASRVGTRPEGVLLFEKGDHEDFCAKVRMALKEREHVTA